jgi:hypothetical protein
MVRAAWSDERESAKDTVASLTRKSCVAAVLAIARSRIDRRSPSREPCHVGMPGGFSIDKLLVSSHSVKPSAHADSAHPDRDHQMVWVLKSQ